MTNVEIRLDGGNVTPVVRVGDTVRRVQGPWSAAVHGLLRHLEAQGFDGSPRFLGIDEQGREILTFVGGELGHYPLRPSMWSDEALARAAFLLRRLHDATIGYVAPENAPWQFVYPDATQHEVICHNDVAPYNMVFVDGQPHALIDFDTAGPGPRVWDLAYAAYRFVPFSQAEAVALFGAQDVTAKQARRLALFCDAYGFDRPRDVLETVEPRLRALCEWLTAGATAGDEARQKMIAEGHLAHYQREIMAFRQWRSAIENN